MKPDDFIPGIYNYCDRWCERCTFCSRCRNYEPANASTPEQNDSNNKAFWDRITNNFAEAIRLLKEKADMYGIELDTVPQEEVTLSEKKKERAAKDHQLATSTMEYIAKGRAILDGAEMLTGKMNELLRHLELGLQGPEEIKVQAETISECREVVSWYLHFVHVKCMRALMGKADDESWEEENGFPKDSDGSAKIALIAMDRSIEAWTALLRLIPAEEDRILPLLALLQKSRRLAEQEFPQARQFVRPGFDE